MDDIKTLYEEFTIPMSDLGINMGLRGITEETFRAIIENERAKYYHLGMVAGIASTTDDLVTQLI